MNRQWLKNIRIENNLTQKGVAEKVNISQPSYHQIECGENNPSVETAMKLGATLGFDWTRLYTDEEKRA